MLKNYFLFSIRTIIKQRIFSIISISGLSLGIASFLIIVLYLQFQFSYDQFHTNKDRIYRVNKYLDGEKGNLRLSYTAPFVADYIKENIPEVESAVRFSRVPLELHYQENSFNEKYIFACDQEVFNVFSFKLLKGNPALALSAPNSIVLSESMAEKYFGEEEPFGKILVTYNEKGIQIPLKVTGIIEDIPQNSHIQFHSLISINIVKNFVPDSWYENDWHGSLSYIMLRENVDYKPVENRISELLLNKVPLKGFSSARLPLQSLTTIFFNPTKDGSSQRGNQGLTIMLMVLGLFILIIASLNYINLSTARSMKRVREVGIRKVLGAQKNQLIIQFLGESIIISFIALILAILLMQFFIPVINQSSNILYNMNLDREFLKNYNFLLISIGTALGTGLLSGIYPALILSRFKSVKALKGNTGMRGSINMRKGLVVLQYVVSIVMIVGSIGIYKVFNFMQTQDLGFDKELLMAVNLERYEKDPRIKELRGRFTQIPGIAGISATSKVPMSLRNDLSYFIKDPETDYDVRVPIVYIDENYFDLLDVKFIIRPDNLLSFSESDKPAIIVNKTFIERFENYYQVGGNVEIIRYNDKNQPVTVNQPEIIGYVDNFKGRNLIFEKPTPSVFQLSSENHNYLLVKLKPETQKETLNSMLKTFKDIFPDHVFEYSFVDDEIDVFMSIVSPIGNLIFYGTFFAIFIASMGLFALALYVTQQKTKEIGIRKVFGATEQKITSLLAGQFVKLVLVSFLIAGPITFFGFREMLQLIPEKIVLEWSLLAGIAIGVLGIALITVWVQSFKAAKTNPIKTLQYE